MNFKKKLKQLRYIKRYSQFLSLLLRKIKSIELAINYVCDQGCAGCYARNLRAEQKGIFLTANDVKEIWEKYHPAHINITGGEPLLNPNLKDIISIIPKSTVVSMVTNGNLLFDDEKILIDKIKELSGLNTIQISYGSNYNMKQNEILGEYISKHTNINVCLSVTNIKKERENIKSALKLCEKNNWHLLFNTPGMGLENNFDYQLYFTYRSHSLVREDNMFWSGANVCPAGVKKFYITADKSLYPCDRMLNKKYNSYKEMRNDFKNKSKVYCRRYEQLTEEKINENKNL